MAGGLQDETRLEKVEQSEFRAAACLKCSRRLEKECLISYKKEDVMQKWKWKCK